MEIEIESARERRGPGGKLGAGKSHEDGRRGKHRSRSPRRDEAREEARHILPPKLKPKSNDDDLSPPRSRPAVGDQARPRRQEEGDRERWRGEREERRGQSAGRLRGDRRGQRSPHDDRRRTDRRERRSPPDREWEREQMKDERRRDDRGPQRREERGRESSRGRGHDRRVLDQDPSQYEFGRGAGEGEAENAEAEKPDYTVSGKLAAETNTYKGVVINYSEPEEARIPKTRWRLYGFKGEETLPTLFVHRQSAYLVGRDRRVCDLPVDHPSCSKQHAVLQYRLVEYAKPGGKTGKRVRPYLIDLNSTNGSYINNERIESAKYYELKEKDMIKFGFSSREYIILHENTKGGAESEDEDGEQKAE